MSDVVFAGFSVVNVNVVVVVIDNVVVFVVNIVTIFDIGIDPFFVLKRRKILQVGECLGGGSGVFIQDPIEAGLQHVALMFHEKEAESRIIYEALKFFKERDSCSHRPPPLPLPLGRRIKSWIH